MTGTSHIVNRIELPAELESLPVFVGEITQCAVKAGVSEHKVATMELALEEAIVNVIKYSSSGPDSLVIVTCEIDGQHFNIRIVDRGPAFNPLDRDLPDTTAGIDDRPIGGLGIFLIKEMTDGVTYTRENDTNILTITMKTGQ